MSGSNSRTRRSTLIMISGVVQKLINILVGFVSRKIFIMFLGIEYLGINGLFTNILSFLSLAELGIGSAVTVYLYGPLANQDQEQIGIFMQFYRKCYFIIGCVVLGAGLLLVPFLPSLINFEQAVDVNLYLVYLLFLANSVSSYWFFAYKSSLIEADQKGYVTNNITTVYSALASILKCVVIILFRQFELALFTELAIGILKNVFIARKADQLYPVITRKQTGRMPAETIRKMFRDVRGLLVQRIANRLFRATDNIIISMVLGTIYVGLCDNYTTITTYIIVIVAMMTASLGASIGNLNAKENPERRMAVFRELDFAGSWISCFCSVCLCQLMTPFVILFFGKEYEVSPYVVLFMSVEFYIATSSNIADSFKTSMGLLREGCYYVLVGGILNVLFSVVWARRFGLPGIFAATIVTKFFFIYLPTGWYLFSKGFGCPPFPYMWRQTKRVGGTIALIFLVRLCCSWISPGNWGGFMVHVLICALVPNLVITAISFRKEEFRAILTRVMQLKRILLESET